MKPSEKEESEEGEECFENKKAKHLLGRLLSNYINSH